MNLAFLSLIFFVCSQQVDFHASENQQQHHTSSYRVPKEILVLRRATNFSLSFSGSVPSGFRLQAVDPFSHKPANNIIRIPVQTESNPQIWQAVTENNKDYIINVPPTASVFIYSFAIEYSEKVVPTNQFVVFLFNPFSKTDTAYLPDAEGQMEYVLNEQGAMWLTASRGTGWTWDHFNQSVLEVTLWFLQEIDHNSRGDLNIVSRFLTSVMNANNGKGLMYGRWREPYSDGKEPWKWVGSGEIFEQFRKTQTPVRYGQCWVFAGVLVSAGRSIGIPARQITNFNSAHEDSGYGPYRLSIDFLTPSDGSEDKSIGSIWNFHAWSEFWFSRSDLKTGEWQVVDATPQEKSDGKYQMGPASQLSVRDQRLDDKWDTRFVASETNAAIRQYVQFKTGKPEHPFMKGYYLAEEQINACGRDITTKSKGSDNAEDITNQYKFKSANLLRHHALLQTKAKEDQDFVFRVNQSAFVVMGSDLFLNLTLQCSLCSKLLVRNLDIQCRIAILSSNGETIATFKNPNGKFAVDSPTVFRFSFPLTANQYQPYLLDADFLQSSLLVQITDRAGNTTQYFSQLKRYEIDAPPLAMIINNVTLNSVGVDVIIFNPLSIPLTNVSLSLSGANIDNVDLLLPNLSGNTKSTVGPIIIHLPNGWTPKGWVTLYAKVTSDEISRMDILVVIFGTGKLLYK